MKMWMQINVMPWTSLGVDAVRLPGAAYEAGIAHYLTFCQVIEQLGYLIVYTRYFP